MDEKEALLALSHVPGLGPIKIRRLIEQNGSALDSLKPGMNIEGWQKDLELCNRFGITLISYREKEYPASLLEISDSPIFLYIKGKLPERKKIAMVGTRNASYYGLESAESIAKDLADNGFCVVSGLARGIDTKAHLGAIASTVAVLGSGLGTIYPFENKGLADKICENGALVSEYPVAMPPSREFFPRRNRIISGLSFGTILVEAPLKSGAMITMDYAAKHKRKCYALPGRSDMDSFRGNHALIKEGKALLIESAKDLGIELNETIEVECLDKCLNSEENNLLQKMHQEVTIEQLLESTRLPIAKLNFYLMSLMLNNRIKEYPGKRYKKR